MPTRVVIFPSPQRPVSRIRVWTAIISGYLTAIAACYVLQDLTLGWLPWWAHWHLGHWPVRPFVFLGTSLIFVARFVRVYGPDHRASSEKE